LYVTDVNSIVSSNVVVVEVLLEVRHYLSDIHQVHLHFTHINIRQIVGHVVHTLLCTIVKVLNFLEALKLTWVATDKFKVLHFFFLLLGRCFPLYWILLV